MRDIKTNWFAAGLVALLLVGCGATERKEQYVERGQGYMETRDFQKARIEFQNALQVEPGNAETHFLLGQALQKLVEPVAAVAQYEASLKANPDHAGARAALARLYATAGATELADKALELIDKGLQQNPDDSGLLTARAAVRLQRREVEGAIADAEKSYGLAPADGETVGLLAAIYFNHEQRDRAIELIKTALVQRPDDAELNLVLADFYRRQGQMELAEPALRKVVELEPASVAHRLQLARFYLDQKNVDAAEAVLREGVKIAPKAPENKTALLVLLSTHRSPEVAERAIKEFLAADSENQELRLSLGDFYVRTAKVEEAKKQYQAVIASTEAGPEGLAARNKLAGLAMRSNDPVEAQRLTDEVLAANPSDADALTLRGALASARGDYDSAIQDLRSVLRDQPDSAPAVRTLAQAHFGKGEVALGEETLRSALRFNQTDPGLRYELAMLLGNTGRHNDALPLLEALSREAPADVAIQRALLAAQLAAQDHASALLTAQQIEKVLPQSALGPFLAGQVKVAAGLPAEAGAEFERALELQPAAIDPLVALVRLDIAAKRLDAANQRLGAALTAQPGVASLHLMQGLIRIEERRAVEARQSLAEAQRLAPTWWEPYHVEAVANLVAGDDASAYAAYRKGIAAVTDKGMLSDQLAALYERNGQRDEAIKVYEELVVLEPGNLVAANNLAMLLVNHRTAEADLRRAAELSERLAGASNPAFLDTRGWVLLKTGKALEALPLLQRAVAAQGENPVMRYHLAVAQLETGDADGARRNLEAALQSGRNFAGRDDAKVRLARIEAAATNRAG